MKKSILISCAVMMACTLTAFTYMNWGNKGINNVEKVNKDIAATTNYLANPFKNWTNTPFVYNVDSRFITTITKEKLHKATSIEEIVPEEAIRPIKEYQEVKVAILRGEDEIHEKGKNDLLTAAQLKLLRSTDYSTDFYITAVYKTKNILTGEMESDYLTYYITIIPEHEAEYIAGHGTMINYLKDNSVGQTLMVEQSKLKPGKVSFVVTKEGTITNVKLNSRSGYEDLDKTMLELISTLPGKWYPATNSKGENVEQEFVFSFGIDGC